MPVQDEDLTVIEEAIPSEVITPVVAEEKGVGHDNVRAVSSSQEKRCYLTLTSPSYQQEEVASHGEPEHIPGMPELLSRTPGTIVAQIYCLFLFRHR